MKRESLVNKEWRRRGKSKLNRKTRVVEPTDWDESVETRAATSNRRLQMKTSRCVDQYSGSSVRWEEDRSRNLESTKEQNSTESMRRRKAQHGDTQWREQQTIETKDIEGSSMQSKQREPYIEATRQQTMVSNIVTTEKVSKRRKCEHYWTGTRRKHRLRHVAYFAQDDRLVLPIGWKRTETREGLDQQQNQ